jgi:hypothetical protein
VAQKGELHWPHFETCKYENTSRSNAKGTADPQNMNAPDDGRAARNMWCSDELKKDLILNLDIVVW